MPTRRSQRNKTKNLPNGAMETTFQVQGMSYYPSSVVILNKGFFIVGDPPQGSTLPDPRLQPLQRPCVAPPTAEGRSATTAIADPIINAPRVTFESAPHEQQCPNEDTPSGEDAQDTSNHDFTNGMCSHLSISVYFHSKATPT